MFRSQSVSGSLGVLLAAVGLFVSGCSTSKQTQLERVAKDWCLTIRASQVIPVYPLTEDIQPGDAFLVQVPINEQQRLYQEKGFLALDNHIARLNPNGYSNFYGNSFLTGITNSILPRDWSHPVGTNTGYWGPAPQASFPSYTFSVRRGGGLNLAVPIQGVPVGLSLMGSDAADGSVTIKQARTLGVDTFSLWEQLKKWAEAHTNFLNHYASSPGANETNYIRVLTRVYATGEMDVNLRDASSRSGGADVGASKPVNLMFPEVPKNSTNVAEVTTRSYTNGYNLLNDMLQRATTNDLGGKFLPGGSLRLVAASSRSVFLKEEFNPPLILGYLGFDCAILENGELGPPDPTHAILDPRARLNHAKVEAFSGAQKTQFTAYRSIAAIYRAKAEGDQQKIRDFARSVKLSADGSGPDWLQHLGEIVDGNDAIKADHFIKLQKFVESLR